jgi:late competence protein required for DNA uptake (superfamily II DNA/RNA helicase)
VIMVVEVDVVDATSVMASKRNVADQSYSVYIGGRVGGGCCCPRGTVVFALSALHVPLNPSGDRGSNQERSKKVTGVE